MDCIGGGLIPRGGTVVGQFGEGEDWRVDANPISVMTTLAPLPSLDQKAEGKALTKIAQERKANTKNKGSKGK